MKHCLVFLPEIFYFTIILCLNILRLIIRFYYTTRLLRKHDVIKVCSVEYLTTRIELVLPTFKSWIIHNIIEYLMLGLLYGLGNIYHSTRAYFV